MSQYPAPLLKLINQMSKLPGIGNKSAQRLAFHIMSVDESQAMELAKSIADARKQLKYCSCCGNLTDKDPCQICSDPTRDRTIICVVESPKDVIAIERMKDFKGLYHVLHGVISPMDGIGPEEINIKSLIRRLQNESQVKELILATNPNIEGEATAMYIARLVKPSGITTSRIANGLPVGGDLEYTDEVTLLKAMEGRREI